MNLTKLFETQRILDEKIVKEKGLEGQDLLDKKILALQVELGELANEWRGFKFWSDRQEPVTNDLRVVDYKESGEAILETYNPFLEEYVDCLHFILSIGLEEYEWIGEKYPINLNVSELSAIRCKNITKQFNRLFDNIGYLEDCLFEQELGTKSEITGQYKFIVELFIGLGEMLGFKWDEIEKAYLEKNKINHERQENGY